MLKRILILFGLVAAFSFPLLAQLDYRDIKDTSLYSNNEYAFDVDNDGKNDFKFVLQLIDTTSGNVYRACLFTYDSNEIASYKPLNALMPLKHNCGDTIDSTRQWQKIPSFLYFSSTAYESQTHGVDFYGAQNACLGLKLVKGSSYFFGYVRFDLTQHLDTLTIKDFALERTPYKRAIACSTAPPLPYSAQDIAGTEIFSVYPNPATDNIVVSRNNNNKYSLKIIDASGRVVKQTNTADGQIGIDVSVFSAGVYTIILLDSEGEQATKRFIKQ